MERKGKELWLDIALLFLPWLCLCWTFVWGMCFGPNANPPWPIGDRLSYDASLVFQFWGLTAGLPVFIVVRFIIHRRRLTLALVTIASSLIAGLLAPALGFA